MSFPSQVSSFWRFYRIPLLLLLVGFIAVYPVPAEAQPVKDRIGVGGQVGNISGLTLKVYRRTGLPIDDLFATKAIDLLAAWDLNDFFFLNMHVVNERPLQDSPLRYFIGPGLVFGVENRGFTLGVSGNLGINFFIGQYEVYLQITPQLELLPGTDGKFGSGVGLRYYF